MQPTRTAGLAVAAVAAFSLAFASTAAAEEYLIDDSRTLSTDCGAGTKEKCADKPIESCDFEVDIGVSRTEFRFKIGFTNCKVIGHVPIYKDIVMNSVPTCDPMGAIVGSTSGSTCK